MRRRGAVRPSPSTPRAPRTADVVALARSGDAVATAAVRAAGRHIGTALAAAVTLLAPRAIGFWGYLTEADAALFAGVREGLYGAALPASTSNLVITRTALGDLAGVRGAASRVLDTVLAPASVDRVLASGTWRS
ncbi:ROK family protein [Curtobacterium sp. NPDC090217]|uniref:ROK family protein n=1 Tax=Curtobacterium sp. NPDC090217 TaxID=3363970 RepID=UPI00381A30C5